jgi:hypothetical protein
MSDVASPILKKIPYIYFIASLTSQLRLQTQNMLIARVATLLKNKISLIIILQQSL